MPAGGWLAIVGGALLVVGTLTPWLTATVPLVGTLNRNAFQLGAGEGLSYQGPIVALMGALTVVIGVTRLARASMPRYLQRSAIVTGIISAIVVVTGAASAHSWAQSASSNLIEASIGYGIWLAGIGAALSDHRWLRPAIK